MATSLRERLARLRVDLTPWRASRDFRILVVSGSVFFLGGMVGYVALPFQLYQLTGSNFAVGAMGLVTIAPLVIFGLYGGALADTAGVTWAYAVELAGLMVATLLFLLLGSYRPSEHSTPPSLRAIGEGITYALRRRDLLGTYAVDMVGMFLAMPIVLFPAFATEVLKEPKLLGLLYSAEAVGAMLATLTSGWARRVHHHGRAVVVATITWGASVGIAGLAPNIWFAIAFFAVAGGADMISGLFRAVIWNQTIPDEMRGRLAGIEMLSYSLGPLGGQSRSGLVADLTSVRTSIVSGGVLCVAGVVVTAVWLKDFWRYDARTDEHAVRERELRATSG